MRVLITNNSLDGRAGSELYVRDVALGLLRRGHQPVAFSTRLGAVAGELRAGTIPVVDDLSRLAVPPDLIHGHHHLETTIAMLHFLGVSVVSFCYGWLPWEECPPVSPRIRRYDPDDATAVSARVRDEAGLEKALDRIEAIYRLALATPPFGDASPAGELRAASRCLMFLAPTLKHASAVAQERDHVAVENRRQQAEMRRMRATWTWRSRGFLLRSRLVRALHRAARRLA